MKKILVLFAVLLVLPLKVNAGSMDSYAMYNENNYAYAKRIKDGVVLKPSVLALFTIDGNTAYCVEPGVLADRFAYYNSTDDNNLVGISDDVSEKLNLIGYFGYDYPGHQTLKFYMATQELIWRETGISDMRWEERYDDSLVYNIEYEKGEILRLIDDYKKYPEFDIEESYTVGDTIVLEDKNNVLEGYEVKEGDITIDGNTITLTVKENNDFTLQRKGHGEGAKYFYKDGYQTIGTFLSLPEYKQSYSIKGVEPEIKEEDPIILEELPNTGKNDMPFFLLMVILMCVYAKKRN